MFNLTRDEVKNAISAIEHHGYSAMLPTPIEWQYITDRIDEFCDHVTTIDLDIYEPSKVMEIFAPKNRANIRIVHLLHPQDLVIYTALVLIIKNDIEAARLSKQSQRIYSYRVDTSKFDRLYDRAGEYQAYTDCLAKKANKNSVKFVGIADIADFYPRIYQHRLENIIETVCENNARGVEVARVLVRKLIASLMKRNSYGIPVGPYASRVLAEAVLIDVDSFLTIESVDFVRWVDDYNIFCTTEYQAQSTLFELGSVLFTNHGLTLQSAKTKILKQSDFLAKVSYDPEKELSDRDQAVATLRDIIPDYGDDDDETVFTEDEIRAMLHQLQSIDLKAMFSSAISDQELVDYELVRYVLSKLPQIPGVSESMMTSVLDFILNNANLLYPVSEHIAKFIASFKTLTGSQKKKIAEKLLKPIKSTRTPPPTYYTMWILWIFSTSPDWNHATALANIYTTTKSEIIKRYAALAISICGTRSEALIVNNDFNSSSPLHRLAILTSSAKLGKDERKHWKLANPIDGWLEKKIP